MPSQSNSSANMRSTDNTSSKQWEVRPEAGSKPGPNARHKKKRWQRGGIYLAAVAAMVGISVVAMVLGHSMSSELNDSPYRVALVRREVSQRSEAHASKVIGKTHMLVTRGAVPLRPRGHEQRRQRKTPASPPPGPAAEPLERESLTSDEQLITFLWQALAHVCGYLLGMACLTVIVLRIHYSCRNFRPFWALLLDWLLSLVKQPASNPRIRSTFSRMHIVKNAKSSAHTHPSSAQNRCSAATQATYFGQELGLEPFYVQQSASDQRIGRAGSRVHYWAKDLAADAAPMRDDPELLVMVDVDYYLDMPSWLTRTTTAPFFLYTLAPTQVARSDGEYSYTINENDEIVYKLSGGAEFQHQLWNYGTDVVLAEESHYWGLWNVSVAYNVDRRQMDNDHQLVLLTPIKQLACPFFKLSHFISGTVLKRQKFVTTVKTPAGDVHYTTIDSQTGYGLNRSTGKPGTYLVANTTAAQHDAIAVLSALGSTNLTVAQVKSILQSDDTGACALLCSFHRDGCAPAPNVAYPIEHSFVPFSYAPKDCLEPQKSAMVPFMCPLSLGSYVPTVCPGNDTQAIVGRVVAVRAPDLDLLPKHVQYMEEFASLLVPRAHTLRPVDQDMLYERQSRPAQRRILDEASSIGGLTDKSVSSFMKKESANNCADPRNITTIPPQNKYEYSRYMYAFSELLRDTEWYAFGPQMTPRAIAERVTSICQRARSVTKTDLSRCDGRVSNLARHLERVIMFRAFALSERENLASVMETQYAQSAWTSTGLKYDTGNSRLSGSPETADFNSLLNAFMAYMTYRDMRHTIAEAWATLGIYGGDDGLSPDVETDIYTRNCAGMGQLLEAEVVKHGQPGVDFLARLYSPEVWHGAADSMCDLKRQVIKFHLTVSLPSNVTAMDKMRQKLLGFKMTDANTPVFRDLIRAAERHAPLLSKDGLETVMSYVSQKHDVDNQYPNNNHGDWMDAEAMKNFPNFDYQRFSAWCSSAESDGDSILSPPLCCEEVAKPKAAEPCVYGSDATADLAAVVPRVLPDLRIVAAGRGEEEEEKSVPPPSVVAPGAVADKAMCPHYVKGKCTFGNKCKFSHGDNSVAQAKPACNDFKKSGACKWGAKCKFSHM